MAEWKQTELEALETDLLLEAIFRRRGYDFRHYARASLNRRVDQAVRRGNLAHITDLISLLLYDDAAFERFLAQMSISVTDMFRDPPFFLRLRETVVPWLKTWPFVKIWCAGCATGEEVYSLAILLKEEGFYDRSRIYATDYNRRTLAVAREGIYPAAKIKKYTANYNNSGAGDSFASYYHAKYDRAKMHDGLRQNVVFSHHNLVTDAVFGEMNLILCRNVLIYFDQELQNRVLELFTASLCPGGFLCLGAKESLQFSTVADQYEAVAKKENIFRRIYSHRKERRP